MPQPPPTHVAARVEVIRLLLPGLRRGTTQERTEPSLSADKAEEEIDGGEDRHAVVGARDRGFIRDLMDAGEEELVAGGYSGDFMETALDGDGGDSWGGESEGNGFAV